MMKIGHVRKGTVKKNLSKSEEVKNKKRKRIPLVKVYREIMELRKEFEKLKRRSKEISGVIHKLRYEF